MEERARKMMESEFVKTDEGRQRVAVVRPPSDVWGLLPKPNQLPSGADIYKWLWWLLVAVYGLGMMLEGSFALLLLVILLLAATALAIGMFVSIFFNKVSN